MKKLTITGAGIVGLFEAYFAIKQALESGEKIRITINEKNEDILKTTSANIFPSLTPDELLSVVPLGEALIQGLNTVFSELDGIRVDDVPGILESEVAQLFIEEVSRYSQDPVKHQQRVKTLLQLGKHSMELWQKLYQDADEKLRGILDKSNFKPCHDQDNGSVKQLNNGYRIDLLYNLEYARTKAEGMVATYSELGYSNCAVLSPEEVSEIDPHLRDFCLAQSEQSDQEGGAWKETACAVWRPGGCIDTHTFIPLFFEYLQTLAGKYTTNLGIEKNCLQLKLGREVTKVDFAENTHAISRLLFFKRNSAPNSPQHEPAPADAHEQDLAETSDEDEDMYESRNFAFCTGENVSSLNELGFNTPAYTGFAGPSLTLVYEVPENLHEKYRDLNHCMEVHGPGTVLAWQARFVDGKIIIGIAGTKAFYGDKEPSVDNEFTLERNLLQLKSINDVLPSVIEMLLGRDTQIEPPTYDDLNLPQLKRWVGKRAVAYDGFPTLGPLYHDDARVPNARVTTHLGSGGVSNALGAVEMSHLAVASDSNTNTNTNTNTNDNVGADSDDAAAKQSDLTAEKIIEYSNSMRHM